MKFVIQRVDKASVKINGKENRTIGKGLVVFIGIAKGDTIETANYMVKKLIGLRVFQDSIGKTNLALKEVGGDVLLISQFTLLANCQKGNRPSFVEAEIPDLAIPLYNYIIDECKKENISVVTGKFGADMKVSIVNDGPFTIVLEK